jgi:hypothetical protein
MKKVKSIFVLIILSGIGCLSAAENISVKADFYVAADGDDRWSGTLPVANAKSSDGPFATLERARDAVRELKTSKDVVVLIREGLYRRSKTVVFGLEDSGEGDVTITYAAYPGEKPVFSSGVEIGGWNKLTDPPPALPTAAHGKVWVADVPKASGARTTPKDYCRGRGRLDSRRLIHLHPRRSVPIAPRTFFISLRAR